ncbi:signal peptidase I [Enterococcus sp. HY326]|uniref:signal peptidase I n=1 Tax=Enterococcus sp. HY326 TaxID=2971265 RepID=UPI00223ECC06|nr:signal peptidase I [Enterococcus sp. HY326]
MGSNSNEKTKRANKRTTKVEEKKKKAMHSSNMPSPSKSINRTKSSNKSKLESSAKTKNQATPKKKSRKHSSKKKYREIPPSKTNKALKVLWDVLFYAFLILIIGGAIFFNFNDSPDKSFFGYRFMTVLTNSMAPNPEKPELTNGFTSGSIIIIQQVNPETLQDGDIITFYPVPGNTESYLTHRVVETMDNLDGEEGFFIQTQGDANTGADIPISGSQVVGKVVLTIPFIGNFLNFIRDNLVVVAIFLATLFGLFVTLKYYIGLGNYEAVQVNKKKRKVRAHQ